jgi:uncharacterized membrane protein
MNCLKIAENIMGIIAFFGFFLLVGAVGTRDYMDEIGQYYETTYLVPQMVIGILMMLPLVVIEKYIERMIENDNL